MGMKAVLVRRSKVEPAPASGVLLTINRKPLTRWKGAGAEDHSIHAACSIGLRRSEVARSSNAGDSPSWNVGFERR
jgi:hypothetical protein